MGLVDMCICINCRWVDRCKAYHAVERQHGVEHLNESPDYEPRQPLIYISLNTVSREESWVEWDVRSCESFFEDNGKWLRLCPDQEVPT